MKHPEQSLFSRITAHSQTLRFRFSLWTIFLLLAMLAGFGIVIYTSLAHTLSASLDDSLRLSGAEVIAAMNIESSHISLVDGSLDEIASVLLERGFSLRLLNPGGEILKSYGSFGSLVPDQAGIRAARERGAQFATHADTTGQEFRVYTTPIIESKRIIDILQVNKPLSEVRRVLSQLLTTLLISTTLLVFVAGFGGFFLAARALAPIDRITRMAQRISAENLTERLNLSSANDELGRLASTFDAMISRLDASFRREQQFSADASHELRTPLAAMQAIISFVREERRSPREYEQALSDLAEEMARLKTLTEQMLLLVRHGKKRRPAVETVELSTLLEDVILSMTPLALDKGLKLESNVAEGLSLNGDRDALVRLFVNLIDNAIKYTEQGWIRVDAKRGPDQKLRVSVSDTGRGIASEHLSHLFDRFYRVDRSRSASGSGLGLSIALGIVRSLGGGIDVSSNPGEGTVVTVQLPSDC